jgi:hypothetical protein
MMSSANCCDNLFSPQVIYSFRQVLEQNVTEVKAGAGSRSMIWYTKKQMCEEYLEVDRISHHSVEEKVKTRP